MMPSVWDLERCSLRPGNVHSADGWRNVLEPVVARYRERNLRRYFRGDAAFAAPDIYEFLEAEGFLYAIRLNGQSPAPIGLTPTFVAVWARTNHLSDQIKKFSIGEVVSKIRMRDLQRIEIPVPVDEAAFDWFTKQMDLHSVLRIAHENLSSFVADLPGVEARLLDSMNHETEIAEDERFGV